MNAFAAVAAALAAALCFAVTSALQHHAASQEMTVRAGDPRLLLGLARRPLWLASNGLDLVGVGLQTLALHWGTLVTVQPLLLSSILLALPLQARITHRAMRPAELLASVLGVVGLTILLLTVHPASGIDSPSGHSWVGVGIATAAVVGIGLGCAAFTSGNKRALALGLATGALYGLTAALIKTCTQLVDHPLQLVTHWQTAALVVAGIGGFVLNQNAFQASGLAAGLLAISLAEPVAGVLIGVTAFGEHLRPTASALGGTVVAAVAVIASVGVLAFDRQQFSSAEAAPRRTVRP